MVKKLLTLDNRERNTIVKMLKRGILDFNPTGDFFYYTKDETRYKLEGEQTSEEEFEDDDDEENKSDAASEDGAEVMSADSNDVCE